MDDDLTRIDEDLMYIRLGMETLWLFLASQRGFDVDRATALIEEALRVVEETSSSETPLARLRESLDVLAGRLSEVARLVRESRRGEDGG